MKSKLTHQLAKHIREIYFGKNWTWVNIQENLEDVTCEEANTKIGNVNTILTLIYHIHYYTGALFSVLRGGPLTGKDKYSFEHPEISTDEEWKAFLNKIYSEVEELASLVEQLDEDKIWEFFTEEKYGNYYRNIAGFVEHSHYHLGQIVMLKKMIRADQIE